MSGIAKAFTKAAPVDGNAPSLMQVLLARCSVYGSFTGLLKSRTVLTNGTAETLKN